MGSHTLVHAPFDAVRVAAKGLLCQLQNPALRPGLELHDLLGGKEVITVKKSVEVEEALPDSPNRGGARGK